MEEIKTPESAVKRALQKILGKKADLVPFDPMSHPDTQAAKERIAQLVSGITPKSGRGSNGGTTLLPEGKGWRPHSGNQQKRRSLRQCWVQFEKLCAKDTWYNTTRERLLDAVQDEPDAEYAALNIAMGAKLASDQKKDWLRRNPPPKNTPLIAGSEWVDALNHALTKWDERHDLTAAQAEADGAVV